ncbi:MAG: hypothetical protein ABH817_02180 [archaeon]
MKRGIFLLILITLLSITNAAALDFQELLLNQWVNAGFFFVIIFLVFWYVLSQFFRASLGAAMIISIIAGLAGSFGIIAQFGPVLAQISWFWIVLLILVAGFLIYKFMDKLKAWLAVLLGVPSLFWLLFGRRNFCFPYGLLNTQTCSILDVLAIILLVIAIIIALIRLFKRFPVQPGTLGKGKELIVRIVGEGAVNWAASDGISGAEGSYSVQSGSKVKVVASERRRDQPFTHFLVNGKKTIGNKGKGYYQFVIRNKTFIEVHFGTSPSPGPVPGPAPNPNPTNPRPSSTKEEANFYMSIKQASTLMFPVGQNTKTFEIGNLGGGRIKWNAHCSPYINLNPKRGTLDRKTKRTLTMTIDRSTLTRGTTVLGAVGVHTLDRKRNKATFSFRIQVES